MTFRQITFNIQDLQTPKGIERILLQIQSAVSEAAKIPKPPTDADLAIALAPAIRDALQADGNAPLNLQDLLPSLVGGAVVIEDTHANRLAIFPAVSYDLGTLFWETDRTVAYVITESGGSNQWEYFAGIMVDNNASKPVDLGTADTGFQYYSTDELTNFEWTGTAFVTIGGLWQIGNDTLIDTAPTVLHLAHRLTSGTAAAGHGLALEIDLENGAGAEVDGGLFQWVWTNAAAGSETSNWLVSLRNAGAALTEYFRVLTTGIRFNVGGFFAILVHANSADRTYTLANEDGTVVLDDGNILTANTLPIGQGTHQILDLADGVGATGEVLKGVTANEPVWGALNLTTDVTGDLPVADGGTGSSTAGGARTNLAAAQIQTVGGDGAGTYTTITSITVTSEGTISAISGS